MTEAALPPVAPAWTRFIGELETLVRTRHPLIWLVTYEELRLEAILSAIAQNHGKQLVTWSSVQGLRGADGHTHPGSENPLVAAHAIRSLNGPSLVVLKDLHPYFADPQVVRSIRELGQALLDSDTRCIFISPGLEMPMELEKDVAVLDVPLPSYFDLANLLRDMAMSMHASGAAKIELRREQAEQLVKAALGLTLREAENAFARAVAQESRLSADNIKQVLEEKQQVIRKSGLLEYYPVDENLRDVGGLENLKAWLASRSAAFSETARAFGLPEPKGLLLLGVQGCGKSLTARAIAAQWSLPLLRLDVGRIFAARGSADDNLRRAIRVAESAAPAVLWLDEVDKALAGVTGDGTTARVFGAFLTWLQEKRAPVFVVATANRIDALPPELLRKGRFDEIFFIDLPDARERAEICAIHLRRRGRDPAKFDCAQLAAFTESFSGAELEQVVVSGLYDAFGQQSELRQEHLVQAVRTTFPLAKTLREEVLKLRQWALDRTRPATTRAP